VILAEDETKVKSRVAWDSKGDHLISFYGPKLQRRCIFHFRPIIGTGEVGYNNIMEAFGNYQIAGFSRVIIVNPLHTKLPRVILVVCCTYNCFNFAWVRQRWNAIDRLWIQECLQLVGLVIGHASDGDSRRRQLMLHDYGLTTENRLRVEWDGWMFSAGLYNFGDI
jgi:hypothetical protein